MEVGVLGALFGVPCDESQADWLILPVPWAVSSSFRSGAERAPAAILEASAQIDLSIAEIEAPSTLGLHMLPISEAWVSQHNFLRPKVEAYLRALEKKEDTTTYTDHIHQTNAASLALKNEISRQVDRILSAGKRPALLGGEHSITEGAVDALLRHYPQMALLHIDAHMDLRTRYTGLVHSHASVMYNILENTSLPLLIQLGIREFSEEEQRYAKQQGARVRTFYADDIHRARWLGKNWAQLVEQMLSCLPEQVYLSLDIDALDPSYCPHTGTPAAGGFSFAELTYLLECLASSGRRILGFDLVEVVPSPDGLDQFIAAQLLYRCCIYAGLSEGLLSRRPSHKNLFT